jgi:hypothetical protein
MAREHNYFSFTHWLTQPAAQTLHLCACVREAHNTQTRKTLKICDMECDALCLVEVHDQPEQCPPRGHRIHTLGFSSAARGFVPLAAEGCFGMWVTTTYFVGADTLSKDTSTWTQKPTTTTTQRHTCEPDGAAMELRVNAEELSALRPRHSVRLRYDVLVVRVRGDASRRRHLNRVPKSAGRKVQPCRESFALVTTRVLAPPNRENRTHHHCAPCNTPCNQ